MTSIDRRQGRSARTAAARSTAGSYTFMYPSWSTGSTDASSSISATEYASGFSQKTASPAFAAARPAPHATRS